MSNTPSGGLQAPDFRMLSCGGFGDGNNVYAHSMEWFKGCLYVGTTRGSMALIKARNPPPPFKPWPVWYPEDIFEVDRRAQIWRYDPGTAQWSLVFQSPWAVGYYGKLTPRYIGFRGMTVMQATGDPEPALYVSAWAPIAAELPNILRSEDGEHFEAITRPPWDETVRSFRTMQPFQGRLHCSPTGSNSRQPSGENSAYRDSMGGQTVIYAADDLRAGNWKPANTEGFGDQGNFTVFEMVEFNDHLYAGTVNVNGFQLWKTDGAGGPPYQWTKVLERGAGRGAHNECAGSLCVYKGALYIGSGVLNGGYHVELKIGPAAAELIRVWPDDSWDLLVGEQRDTEQGLKYPLSGYGAGFDSIFNGYIWRMVEHQGWLYAGTLNWANIIPYLPAKIWPEDVQQLVHRWGGDAMVHEIGGCNLWRSQDGVAWEPVLRDGFGNPYNWGIRTFASTPVGLFVGTANPFGPSIAVRRQGGWTYVPNPRGGCEVHLGVAA